MLVKFINISLDQLNELLDEKFIKIINAISEKNKGPSVDQWFDLKGLIEYLPFKPKEQTIYDWVHKRIIPFHKVPNTKMLIFLQSEIDEWLKSGRRKTQAEKGTEVNKYLNFKK
jgi:hypothetical protein